MEQQIVFTYTDGMKLPPEINFAELCKELRAQGKWTQKEISQKLSVPLRTYESWERGDREPTGRNAIRILALRDELEAKSEQSKRKKK